VANERAIESFAEIPDKMLWKKPALQQIEEFKALAERLHVSLEVAGSHTSKSIHLPVVQFKVGGSTFTLRDNFYDVNVCVQSCEPLTLSYAEMLHGVCEPLTWEWYLEEVAKCRGYTWRYFTDEEMDDPRILRVQKLHEFSKPGDNLMDWTVNADRKDRWVKRMSDPAWYSHDWSAGQVCWDGEFGPGATLFVQGHPYLQGISDVVPREALDPYKPGTKMFSIAVGDMKEAEALIRTVCAVRAPEVRRG
jgi:hypothetical protein